MSWRHGHYSNSDGEGWSVKSVARDIADRKDLVWPVAIVRIDEGTTQVVGRELSCKTYGHDTLDKDKERFVCIPSKEYLGQDMEAVVVVTDQGDLEQWFTNYATNGHMVAKTVHVSTSLSNSWRDHKKEKKTLLPVIDISKQYGLVSIDPLLDTRIDKKELDNVLTREGSIRIHEGCIGWIKDIINDDHNEADKEWYNGSSTFAHSSGYVIENNILSINPDKAGKIFKRAEARKAHARAGYKDVTMKDIKAVSEQLEWAIENIFNFTGYGIYYNHRDGCIKNLERFSEGFIKLKDMVEYDDGRGYRCVRSKPLIENIDVILRKHKVTGFKDENPEHHPDRINNIIKNIKTIKRILQRRTKNEKAKRGTVSKRKRADSQAV